MHVNTRALIGVAGMAIGLSATLTASAFIWAAATDPLWMVTMAVRVLMGLW